MSNDTIYECDTLERANVCECMRMYANLRLLPLVCVFKLDHALSEVIVVC